MKKKIDSQPKNEPLVSIIIPTLNQGQYIRQTIKSILDQSYQNCECLVIDGGSTDETIRILNSFGRKIKYISERDSGQSDAINKGLKMATGDIVGYLNSDDFLNNNAIMSVVNAFQSNDALWVTGDYSIVNENGTSIQSAIVLYKNLFRLVSSRFLIKIVNYLIQPGTFWKRELHHQIGYFDTSLHYAMDYDFWLRAFQIKSPVILRKKLSSFRVHEKSKGGSQFEKQFNEEMLVLKRYCSNRAIIGMHQMHNKLIKSVYRIIK